MYKGKNLQKDNTKICICKNAVNNSLRPPLMNFSLKKNKLIPREQEGEIKRLSNGKVKIACLKCVNDAWFLSCLCSC